jgi:hypothetical protein
MHRQLPTGGIMENDNVIDPEDVNSAPADAHAPSPRDPNDEIPVPIAMSPAEIDERAQVVDALRDRASEASRLNASSNDELTP